MKIIQETINRMRVMRGASTFPNGYGKMIMSSKTGIMEEGAIGDESTGGPMLVRGRRE